MFAGDEVMDGVTLRVPADGTGAHDASRNNVERRIPRIVLLIKVNEVLEPDVDGFNKLGSFSAELGIPFVDQLGGILAIAAVTITDQPDPVPLFECSEAGGFHATMGDKTRDDQCVDSPFL